MKKLLCIFLLFTSYTAIAAVQNSRPELRLIKPKSYVLCKAESLVRTIRIEKNRNGCEAKYTKFGVDRVIGFGRSQNACEPFLENVRSNLENANWSCRKVKTANITAAVSPQDNSSGLPEKPSLKQ